MTELYRTPTSGEIKMSLDAGASFEDVDELFYPGDRARHKIRQAKYQIPEGTGRENPSSDEMRWVTEFKKDQYTIGVRERQLLYIKGIYVGYIDEIRKAMCEIHYKTHDGEEFAHWGGPTGAEWHLINRYWRYGNPPEKAYRSKHVSFEEFSEKVKSGKITVDLDHYKRRLEWNYKRNFPWIKLTDERIEKEALDRAYYDHIKTKNEECSVVLIVTDPTNPDFGVTLFLIFILSIIILGIGLAIIG